MLGLDRKLNYGREIIRDFAASVAPFQAVLDIGAGGGYDLASARSVCPEATLYAIESWPPNVAKLKQDGVQVTGINLERAVFPFGDEFFDIVMANQTLEHLKEIFWVLHEVSRTLKIGGHLIIGVPNLASLHSRLMLLAGMQPTSIQNHSAHVRGYTKHDLLRLFRMVFPGGYALESFRGANFYPLPPVLARPAAKLLPNSAAAIFLMLRKQKAYQAEFLEHPVRAQLETNFYLGEQGGESQVPKHEL